MEKRVIFNPLDVTPASESSDSQVSVSSLINSDVGTCPKCKAKMTYGIIANSDKVFYCESCRVSTPMPDTK